jgi:hypothetical protein
MASRPMIRTTFFLSSAQLCTLPFSFFHIRRSHSISFTRAQGIPKYKIGFGRGKGWESFVLSE